jgi:hypothetical protein
MVCTIIWIVRNYKKGKNMKIIIIILQILFVFTLIGCSSEEVKRNEPKEITKLEPEITLISCEFNEIDEECQNFSNGSKTCNRGDCKEGDCTQGKGKKDFSGGSFIEGTFKKGLLNGVGTLSNCNGAKAEGIFKDGYLEKGTITDTDGNVYIGSLKNKLYDGKGKLLTSNGEQYEGNWKNGKKNGKFSIVISDEKSSVTYQDDEDVIEIAARKKEEAAEKKRLARMAFWSDYQGRSDYDSAKAQCKSIGMRLPTLDELKIAFREGTMKSWENDFDVYWSSTPYTRVQYYRGNRIQSTWYHGIIIEDNEFRTNQYPSDNEWGYRCHR